MSITTRAARLVLFFGMILLRSCGGGEHAYAQQGQPIKPSQIEWPLATGNGTPTAIGQPCTSLNLGAPYQDTSVVPNVNWSCGTDGSGGYVWTQSSGGGGALPSGQAGQGIGYKQSGTTGTPFDFGTDAALDTNFKTDSRGGFSALNGVNLLGTSLMTNPGHGLPPGFGISNTLVTSTGGQAPSVVDGQAIAGSSCEDIAFWDFGTSLQMVGDTGNPTNASDCGTNNANNGVNSGYLLGYKQALLAHIFTNATSSRDKSLFTDPFTWTAAGGTWTTVDPFVFGSIIQAPGSGCSTGQTLSVVSGGGSGSGLTFKVTAVSGGGVTGLSIATLGLGYAQESILGLAGGGCTGVTAILNIVGSAWTSALEATTSGSTLTSGSLYVGASKAIGITYATLPASYGAAATFTVTMDIATAPVVLQGQLMSSTTISGVQQGLGRLIAGFWPVAPAGEMFTGIPPGYHTFTLTTTSNGIFIPFYWVRSSIIGYNSSDGPSLGVVDVPPQQNNANAATIYQYSQATNATVNLIDASFGLNNVKLIPVGWVTTGLGSPSVPYPLYVDPIRDFLSDTTVSLTNCAVAGNVATLTGTNSYLVNQKVYIYAFTTNACAQLNGLPITITSASGSSFQGTVGIATIASTADTGSAISYQQGCISSNAPPLHGNSCFADDVAKQIQHVMKIAPAASGGFVTHTEPGFSAIGIPAYGWSPKVNGFGTANCTWSVVAPTYGDCPLGDFTTPHIEFLDGNGALAFRVANDGTLTSASSLNQTAAGRTNTYAGADLHTGNLFTYSSLSNAQNFNFDVQGGCQFHNWRTSAQVNQWTIEHCAPSNLWELVDDVNSAVRMSFVIGGATNINSGAGANIIFNGTAHIDNAGNLTVLSCTLSGGGSCGSGSAGIGSIAWALPSWLAASPGTLSASGTQTFSPATGQTSHQVIGTCGAGTTFVPCVEGFADLSGNLGTAQGPSGFTGLIWDAAGNLSQATAANIVAAIGSTPVANATAAAAVPASGITGSPVTGGGANIPTIASNTTFAGNVVEEANGVGEQADSGLLAAAIPDVVRSSCLGFYRFSTSTLSSFCNGANDQGAMTFSAGPTYSGGGATITTNHGVFPTADTSTWKTLTWCGLLNPDIVAATGVSGNEFVLFGNGGSGGGFNFLGAAQITGYSAFPQNATLLQTNFGSSTKTTAQTTVGNGYTCATIVSGNDGTNEAIYLNGIAVPLYQSGPAASTYTASGPMWLGNTNVVNWPGKTTVFDAKLDNAKLTAGQVMQDVTAIAALDCKAGVTAACAFNTPQLTQASWPSTAPQIAFFGDSHLAGLSGPSPVNASYLASVTLQGTAQTNGIAVGYGFHELGIGGVQLTANILPIFYNYVAPYVQRNTGSVIGLDACTNDIAASVSAQGCMTAQAQFAGMIHAYGAKAVSLSMLSRTGLNSQVDAFNALWRQECPTYFDACIDVAADPNLGADNAFSNATYFQADGIHLTATGQALVAAYVSASLNRLLFSKGAYIATTAATTLFGSESLVTGNPASASYTLTAPSALAATGTTLSIRNIQASGTNTLSLASVGSQTFGGQASPVKIANNTTVSFYSNGVNWIPNSLTLTAGTPTFTAGAGVTSVACATGYICTDRQGELTIVGGTATTGTIATVNFSATLGAAPGICSATQNGGATLFGIGHGTPSTSSFTVTAGISVISSTLTVDYGCAP